MIELNPGSFCFSLRALIPVNSDLLRNEFLKGESIVRLPRNLNAVGIAFHDYCFIKLRCVSGTQKQNIQDSGSLRYSISSRLT